MSDDPTVDGEGIEDRARAGVEHLQAAAREAISAARALLDVAEELVEDPAAVQAAVGSLGSIVQAALSRVRPPVPPGGPGGPGDAGGDGDDGRVQRIKVS
jgi:hypothetical protein